LHAIKFLCIREKFDDTIGNQSLLALNYITLALNCITLALHLHYTCKYAYMNELKIKMIYDISSTFMQSRCDAISCFCHAMSCAISCAIWYFSFLFFSLLHSNLLFTFYSHPCLSWSSILLLLIYCDVAYSCLLLLTLINTNLIIITMFVH
jgi:hypothetical protein